MSAPLYTTDILRLAMAAATHPRLPAPHASVDARTPVCGSSITLDIVTDGVGSATSVGFTLHACAMGQAAAGIMAGGITGRTLDDITATVAALTAWLDGRNDTAPDWPGIAALAPARAYPARHAAILMPFRAAADALRAAPNQRNDAA